MSTSIFARLFLYKLKLVARVVKCQGTRTFEVAEIEFLAFDKSCAFKRFPSVRAEFNFTDFASFKGVHFSRSPLDATFVCLFRGFIFEN